MPALTTFKLLGLAGIASYALARGAVRLGFISWHRSLVVAVPRANLPVMPRGFVVRSLSAQQLSCWTIDVTPSEQAARFAQGLDCLGAFNASGALTGVVWIAAKGCAEGNVALSFRPPPGTAWDMGMWIHPDHRLGRSFQALWAGVAEWLDARGLSASYSGIADYNMNSQGAHRRLGMQAAGSMTALRIGGWQWIAAGHHPWRMVRAGTLIEWEVPAVIPPKPSPAAIAPQAPSIAA